MPLKVGEFSRFLTIFGPCHAKNQRNWANQEPIPAIFNLFPMEKDCQNLSRLIRSIEVHDH